jgi:hypothetical protein
MSPGAPFEGRKFRSRAPVLVGAGRGRPGRRDFSGGAALGGGDERRGQDVESG